MHAWIVLFYNFIAKAVQSKKARQKADSREATIGEVESETVAFTTGNSLRDNYTTNTSITNQENITSKDLGQLFECKSPSTYVGQPHYCCHPQIPFLWGIKKKNIPYSTNSYLHLRWAWGWQWRECWWAYTAASIACIWFCLHNYVGVKIKCSSRVCPNLRARRWIQCCLCNGWLHWTCAGVLWRDAKKDDYVYRCSSCSIVHSVSWTVWLVASS